MPNPASSRALLIRLLALTSGFPLMAAHADSVWDPIELPKSETVRWQPLPAAPAPTAVEWQRLPVDQDTSAIVWEPISDDEAPLIASPFKKPSTLAEAERLLDSIEPSAENYWPLLRLGPALPTANQVDECRAPSSASINSRR